MINLTTGNTVSLATVKINGNTLTITTTSNHLSGDTYKVIIPASAVKDPNGLVFLIEPSLTLSG